MLDFVRLNTPPEHGDVMVAPDPSEWVAAALDNAERLRTTHAPVMGRPLCEWRRETRMRIAGRDDRAIIVVGHQPEFIHPGVWAKQVAADRVARAMRGEAINLVVDNDSPKNATLRIPAADGAGFSLRVLRIPKVRSGPAYEQFPGATAGEIEQLRGLVLQAMGERYSASAMAAFFDGLAGAGGSADWVDQMIAGRRSAERSFGVHLTDVRVSRIWWSPLLGHMLASPERFAVDYNAALAWYRREFRVRGANRPIPDLLVRGDEVELPVWAYRTDEVRRRLYVARRGRSILLSAESESVATLTDDDLKSSDDLAGLLAERGGWRVRPRALTLTLWARLFLADLFVHGIGGAKYDRIADRIITDHFGIRPPEMACVSATLHVFPCPPRPDEESVAGLRRAIRDMTWNPQRSLPGEFRFAELVAQRAAAVRRGHELREHDPRNRVERREAFRQIREVNRRMLDQQPGMLAKLNDRLRLARQRIDDDRIARDREYFFALHDRRALEELLTALPGSNSFRV